MSLDDLQQPLSHCLCRLQTLVTLLVLANLQSFTLSSLLFAQFLFLISRRPNINLDSSLLNVSTVENMLDQAMSSTIFVWPIHKVSVCAGVS